MSVNSKGIHMKYCPIALCCVGLVVTAQAYRDRFDESMSRMFARMEQQFEEMSNVNTYARTVLVTEDGGVVRVSLPVDKSVTVKDVLVEIENGVLHLIIERPERIDLSIEERWLTLTAERRESGSARSSFSCASEQLTLPAVVDISTVKVDLTDSNLTLSFDKNPGKNRQRVAVTQGGVTPSGANRAVPAPKTGEK